MNLISLVIEYGAPILYVERHSSIGVWKPELIMTTSASLITSPLTSYADQILSIHRTRTSAGFSLDIPLIMLVASIMK